MAEGYRSGPTEPRTLPPRAMSLTDAAAAWARITGGPRPHTATIRRWCIRGCRGIRLSGERAGNGWLVSLEALRDFHQRLNVTGVTSPDRSAGPARAAQIASAMIRFEELTGRKVAP